MDLLRELRRGPNLPGIGKEGFLGLDLKKGTTFEEAGKLAAFLREHITTVSQTT